MFGIDFTQDAIVPMPISLEHVTRAESTSDENFFVVHSFSSSTVVQFSGGKINSVLKIEPTNVFALSIDSTTNDPIFLAYYDALMATKIYNLKSGKNILNVQLGPERQAPIKQLVCLASGKIFEILTVRSDCRMDLHEAQIELPNAAIEWTRFEGLATIASVEMLDLPLSESQATIETEFTAKEGIF